MYHYNVYDWYTHVLYLFLGFPVPLWNLEFLKFCAFELIQKPCNGKLTEDCAQKVKYRFISEFLAQLVQIVTRARISKSTDVYICIEREREKEICK
jgi:hypothetical protein